MTCRFLDTLTLATLVAPFPEEEFRRDYWEQKPLIVHRNDSGYYGELFTLRDFDEALTRSPGRVRTANAATSKTMAHESVEAGSLEGILSEMRGGGTLILEQMHNRDPKLALLCRQLGPELGHRFQTNLYLTPPNGKGFPPHWDNHDVFILQVLGSKHWKIEKERRTFPVKTEHMEDEGRELRGELYSFTLSQGDVVYIPRGFVHAAECGAEPSLHITFGVTAVFLEDLLSAVIKAAVQRDERLRVALPLGFMHGGQEALVEKAMSVLHEIADKKFISGVVDQYRDELVKSFPLDVWGQVANFFQPTPVNLGDAVGARRGILYRMHNGDDTVRLNFGARSITFPGFFGEALDFALTTRSFAVRDLPGELEDQERIVFIERLIQEGLVVRQ